jgi:hypothetical protein
MIEIEIRARSSDYHAQIKGHPELWGCGKNPDEAVGSMVRNHSERLGLDIRFIEPVKRRPSEAYLEALRAIPEDERRKLIFGKWDANLTAPAK